MARTVISESLFTGAHSATGIVSPVMEYVANPTPGAPRPQRMTEDGRLVWRVECMRQVQVFDAWRTEVYEVHVPSRTAPVVAAGPVRFEGLVVTVDTRTTRGGDRQITGVTERVTWAAEAVRPAEVAK